MSSPDSDKGKISGKLSDQDSLKGKIAGSNNIISPSLELPSEPFEGVSTIDQRISLATRNKGLKSLPTNFGDTDGDWISIESDNLFKTLYLDHKEYFHITPEAIKINYNYIYEFWKEKKNIFDSGSSNVREMLANKYKAENLNSSLDKLKYAYDQLNTSEKINDYYKKLKHLIISNAEQKLEKYFNIIISDQEADPGEIQHIYEEGYTYDLTDDDISSIIKRKLDSLAFIPFRPPSGLTLKEQLLSTSWMAPSKIALKQAEEAEKKKNGREIFDNVFAYSVEDIGELMFNHEGEAKQYIKDGLLVNSIDYFSSPKAKQFLEIKNNQKSENLRYLQITYRLNSKLPYRFSKGKLATSISELCSFIFETEKTFKSGKEHFKQGDIEIWLLETNHDAYKKFVKIRDGAENVDLAFLEFLYTFNPLLPYRFHNTYLVYTPMELFDFINKDGDTWQSGKNDLFSNSFSTWLRTTGKLEVFRKWENIKSNYLLNLDEGLEEFLHLLNPQSSYGQLAISQPTLSFPKIPGGKNIHTSLTLTNLSRGYLFGDISFTKELDGVAVDQNRFTLLNPAGKKDFTFSCTIDSSKLLKGTNYSTSINISSGNTDQIIEVPITFDIVFPSKYFAIEIIKFAVIIGSLFGLSRYALSTTAPDWLNSYYFHYINLETMQGHVNLFGPFGWLFLPLLFTLLLYLYLMFFQKRKT